MIYALVAQADAATMPDTIDIMADLSNADAPGLPLADLTSFGFEIPIRKALNQGLTDAFRTSRSYQEYAAARAEVGVV